MPGDEPLGRGNVIKRPHFLFQEGNMLIKHRQCRFKLSNLLVYSINLAPIVHQPVEFSHSIA
jgi:hypothetical protein